MKVALIGNMNNNHFSMMRYFHDLGVEAYLFKYANEAAHFQPECDTNEIDKWSKYIIQTELIGGDFKQYLRLSSKKLKEIFGGFDYYIGNGFTPSYLNKAGIKLDIFTPYCVGIEFTFKLYKSGFVDTIKEKLVAYTQNKAITNGVKVMCSLDKETLQKGKSLKVRCEELAIPMVYTGERSSLYESKDIINRINSFDLRILSHVSHFPKGTLAYSIKRNDILINAFANYINKNKSHKSCLILLEYGEDVNSSKSLIQNLGITENVIWLPKMFRKDLMSIIDLVDIGASEFGGFFWGGTGWEFFSKGKLFFHYTGMNKSELEDLMKVKVPPFIDSNSIEYISNKMEYYYHNRNELIKLKPEIKEWFEQNFGLHLAQKYIDLLKSN